MYRVGSFNFIQDLNGLLDGERKVRIGTVADSSGLAVEHVPDIDGSLEPEHWRMRFWFLVFVDDFI